MIPERIVRELRYIEISTAKKMRTLRVGTYTSPLRGSGFDFDEHRPYRVGDDVRRIDWNVTARVNAPYIRETHAERELNVVIAVDLTRSMHFGAGGRPKKEVMTFITGSILFSALADQINTGFLAFSDRVLTWSPPRRTKAHAWNVLEKLWDLDPPKVQTAILPAVRFLTSRLTKASIIFLVSDFITDEDLGATGDLRVLTSRHDVIAVLLEDPFESMLPAGAGFVRMRDLESGAELSVGLGSGTRKRFAEASQEQRQELIRGFYRLGMDHVCIRSDRNVIEPVLRMFEIRKRR